MKHILVPFDFSVYATNAFRFALSMAGKSNATVHLLHVVELPILVGPMLIPLNNYESAYHKELTDKAEKEFTKVKNDVKTDGTSVVSKTVFGSAAVQILAEIKKESIDLVIMGSQGLSGVAEFFMGSTTAKVVRKSPVPVLVIKNYSTGEIKNIVFPNALDSNDQESLVSNVKALQEFFHARLHIVYINTPLNFSSDVITYQKLKAFAVHFGLNNYTIDVYNNLEEKEGIRQFAKKINGDLIAIGTHGHNGISHLVSGSLAEDIAEHSDIPIWTYSLKNETVEA